VDAAGNIYYMVGNGPPSPNPNTTDVPGFPNFSNISEAMLKFSAGAIGRPSEWFWPSNWQTLDGGDQDYGSSGPILIPGTDLVTGAGKSGTFYVMHSAPLAQVVQSFGDGGEVEAGPIFWNHTGGLGPSMYEWSNNKLLNAYQLMTGASPPFNPAPASSSSSLIGNVGGAALAVSANGGASGTGIVWASASSGNSDGWGQAAVLMAFNADNLQQELYSSSVSGSPFSVSWGKFVPPTVANGHVYVATVASDGKSGATVGVYGLLNHTYPTAAGTLAEIITGMLLNSN
jgi:hypothetical protein